ncbi:conjugal transfer protein [Lelliottia amnigena]|uniref:TrbM/KikA/MpfK family conjugal transfer protein n=1 Tax=Lelliottia amnigena TaxID=61646 RepID=UPI00103D9100|nr:TrbM/KikA/MpfK family conjugal transfer protein [Lelliottia amnigena]TCD12262.1 conjugal transfer protein [Lelliottia amnigena]
MKLKHYVCASILVGFSANAANDNQLLTGEVGLSCEAILCLSTSKTPGECDNALSHFYSINAKKLKDKIKKRKKFLSLCPASKEEGMPALNDAIANGAGRCDADYLNRTMQEEKITSECKGGNRYETCKVITWKRISSSLPGYCKIYRENDFTDLGLNFVGESVWQKEKDFHKKPNGYWKN